MAYELHLERDAGIEASVWRATVAAVDGVRIVEDAEQTVTNPATGELITIAGSPLDAELLVEGVWVRAFAWRSGRVSFAARRFEDGSPLHRAARALAERLEARIVGDEGEEYE